jgi:hypothetical protein
MTPDIVCKLSAELKPAKTEWLNAGRVEWLTGDIVAVNNPGSR